MKVEELGQKKAKTNSQTKPTGTTGKYCEYSVSQGILDWLGLDLSLLKAVLFPQAITVVCIHARLVTSTRNEMQLTESCTCGIV